MKTDRGGLAALLATMTVMSTAAIPAAAQTPQAAPVRGLEGLGNPAGQDASSPSTIPIPDAPKIVLPGGTQTQTRRAPRPRVAAPATERSTTERPTTARPTTERPATERSVTQAEPKPRTRTDDEPATRSSPDSAPAPIATETPAPTVAPAPTAASPTAAPQTETTPQPEATASPTPTPAPEAALTAPETGRSMPFWLWLAVIVIVIAALWALRRRKPGAPDHQHTPPVAADPVVEDPAVVEPVAYPVAPAPVAPAPVAPAPVPTASAPVVSAPVDTPPTLAVEDPIVAGPAAPKFLEPRGKAPPPPVVAPRARLTCDIRPLRAGLNFLSATVECELVVANTGDAHAEAIRAGVALLAAHAGHDADLAAFNAAWVARPAATPFALAPGETRTIRTVVAIARDAIQPMTAANRPMFVPVVATNILYTTNGDDAQAARAWVVGIERVDSAKLAPFWLDAPARMFTTVAARPHGATFDR